ncbi:MAG: 6,7-dimethyl-8-ribityllumazine synthase [Proteobacteria bacterium]|nr:6,7-dimethyl-8-ribityllumazine synthase [Pseudomonadota bacterium]MCL2306656.1 6,7-dimethyl-8-ribityllumazine synthase [Pseudomonadota bacterium]
MTPHEIPSKTQAAGMRIGIVLARFNVEIGEGLLKGALRFLHEKGVVDAHITLLRVPGALEIPLALQGMAQTGQFHALIALGAVIRGETYHFEVVSNESARGISDVALDFDIAIGNGVLTCETDEQAIARMDQKGYEAALAAVELANTLERLRKNAD